jgi:hypothetical protein
MAWFEFFVPPLGRGNQVITVRNDYGQQATVTIPKGAKTGQQMRMQAIPDTPTGAPLYGGFPENTVAGNKSLGRSRSLSEGAFTALDGGATPSYVSITVPQGCTPGQQLVMQAPNGRQVTFQLPAGAYPGQQINVAL